MWGLGMKYTKPSLSFSDQADLLLKRGLISDRDFLISKLKEVNYYRLSGYLYSFRERGDDNFKAGTDFNIIWDQYVFDRQLRVLVMDAIERVEVSVGTRLTNAFVLKYGPFGYIKRSNFYKMNFRTHKKFLSKIHNEAQQSNEIFVKHYFSKYNSEKYLPLWMAIELMSFGALFTFFMHSEQYIQREVAAGYNLHAKVLESWLRTINSVRNICAHHSRLWNRILVKPIKLPDKKHSPEFYSPVQVPPDRIFAVLTILSYMVKRIAPQSGWQERLRNLWGNKHKDIPLYRMGFPNDWEKCAVWR